VEIRGNAGPTLCITPGQSETNGAFIAPFNGEAVDAQTARLTHGPVSAQAHSQQVAIPRLLRMRIQKFLGTCAAVAAFGLSFAHAALGGPMDALLGDWDLNLAKSSFEPSPPMKK
jgi:hypothetical protein